MRLIEILVLFGREDVMNNSLPPKPDLLPLSSINALLLGSQAGRSLPLRSKMILPYTSSLAMEG